MLLETKTLQSHILNSRTRPKFLSPSVFDKCLKLKFFSFFKAEILDATKGDIINALVAKLTNLMNEQRLNELAKLPMGSMEAMEAMEAEVII